MFFSKVYYFYDELFLITRRRFVIIFLEYYQFLGLCFHIFQGFVSKGRIWKDDMNNWITKILEKAEVILAHFLDFSNVLPTISIHICTFY